ncbi:ABC transporter ATP-binding protein [Polaromonas sp. JS666]|uniref:ABC transporter ATP-binding protein n=1 Tax=Polaromonas sp. (strain JS666 / ATCC BAA-500) TaxID=296591 RepID=UPI000046407A|nr:ABC transporter ATP-binding protein [Polaromonas sp. JS666]ABE43105.1 glycine betaine/L-proline transport ATP binding subunit [Polaromonas sp. JS666]
MITLDRLTKSFGTSGQTAVDGLSLTINAGEICVLIGPSGCGKTTTMRMINRMVEPDSGRIEVDGQDVTRIDAVELRRSIGYVIQQVGLFPHMTIGENVATVPKMLGWDAPRIALRVDELLALVHMEPSLYRDRFPRELSGGQKQRVGVARALAADPPVMLMDEPFGAIDPITRASLQDEFLRILRELGKTIVFVTHDIDEAIKMATRIAILRAGKVVQYDTPERILAHPADSFVEAFVGEDRSLKRLSLLTTGLCTDAGTPASSAPRVSAGTPLRDALSAMLDAGAAEAAVVNASGDVVGRVTLDAIRTAARVQVAKT